MSRVPGMHAEHLAIRELRRQARLVSRRRLLLAPRHHKRAMQQITAGVAYFSAAGRERSHA